MKKIIQRIAPLLWLPAPPPGSLVRVSSLSCVLLFFLCYYWAYTLTGPYLWLLETKKPLVSGRNIFPTMMVIYAALGLIISLCGTVLRNLGILPVSNESPEPEVDLNSPITASHAGSILAGFGGICAVLGLMLHHEAMAAPTETQ